MTSRRALAPDLLSACSHTPDSSARMPPLDLILLAAALGLVVLVGLLVLLWRRRRLRHGPRPDLRAASRRRAEVRARLRDLLRAPAVREPPGRPIWLVLGPPGHGKSALLGAVDGARELDPAGPFRLFLTPTAVLIELPSGHVAEDSDRDEAALLAELRRLRPDQPIHGVLLVLRADLAADPSALAALRRRLLRISSELAVLAPIFVLVAQLDRLAGVDELTATLSSRAAPLGVSLTACSDPAALTKGVLDAFRAEDGPIAWARRRACASLARLAPDDPRAARLYGAWPRLELAVERVAAALARLVDPADRPPLPLRAIYLLSADPTANPDLLDLPPTPLTPSLTTAQAPTPQGPPTAPPLFLNDLFALALPRASLAARRSPALLRRRTRLAAGASLAALLLALAAALFTGDAARARRALALDTASHARALAAARGAALPLSDLLALDDAAAAWDASPALRALLLPTPRVGADLREALRGALCRGVLRPLALRSERALRGLAARGADAPLSEDEWARGHERLHLYLLLTGPAAPEEPDLRDMSQSTWAFGPLSAAWAALEGDVPDPRRGRLLRRHLDLLAEPLPARPLLSADLCAASGHARAHLRDPALVAAARELLHRRPSERALVDQIAAVIDRDPRLRPVERLGLSAAAALRGDARVSPAFTRGGWEAFRAALRDALRARDAEAWVLGGPDAPPRERCALLRAAYVERYERAWRDFFVALRLRAPAGLPEAASTLQELIERAPLRPVFQAIAEHTQGLRPLGCPDERPLAALLPAPPKGAPDAPELAAAFAPLVTFAAADKQSTSPLDAYQARLGDLHSALARALEDRAELPALQAAAVQARRGVDELLRGRALGPWSDPLRRLLAPPLAGVELLVHSAAGRDLHGEWCAAVVRPLEQLVARYPFRADARLDVRLDDLTRLLHPQTGELARFRDARLGGLVALAGDRVHARELGAGAALHLDRRALALLDAAHQLGVVLFPGEAPQLAADLTMACDASIHRVVLRIDGAEHVYTCSIDQTKQITWPGEGQPRGAILTAHGPAGRSGELPALGELGLLRLLERGAPEGRPGAFRVRFDLERQSLGVLEFSLRPRPVRGGDLFHGRGESTFLAPFRARALVEPAHALFTEITEPCP